MLPILKFSARNVGPIAGVVGLAASLLIMPHEGKENVAYYDPPKIPTICWGHTKGVKITDVATDEQCIDFLKEDLTVADRAVRKHVKVPMSDGTHAALISFVFNVGEGNFQSSTLLKELNKGRKESACDQLLRWVYAKKDGVSVKLRGLVSRRSEERKVCLS